MMNEIKITGTVVREPAYEEGISQQGNAWRKGLFIIETDEQYPKKIAITMFGTDRINTMSPIIKNGVLLNIYVNIESRSFISKTTGKELWSTDISAWKVEDAMAAGAQQAQQVVNSCIPQGGQMPPQAPAAMPYSTQQPVYQQPAYQAAPQQQFAAPQQAYVPQGNNIPQPGAPAAPGAKSDDLPF